MNARKKSFLAGILLCLHLCNRNNNTRVNKDLPLFLLIYCHGSCKIRSHVV